MESPVRRARLHNKSGKWGLSLCALPQERLALLKGVLKKHLTLSAVRDELIPGSSCVFIPVKDGRLTLKQKKDCYAYQLVALQRYGHKALLKVSASKLGTDPCISHICGSEHCCNPDHLFLESKRINDERTSCHNVLKSILRDCRLKDKAHRYQRFITKNKYRYCSHEPRCATVPSTLQTEDLSQLVTESLKEEEQATEPAPKKVRLDRIVVPQLSDSDDM